MDSTTPEVANSSVQEKPVHSSATALQKNLVKFLTKETKEGPVAPAAPLINQTKGKTTLQGNNQ